MMNTKWLRLTGCLVIVMLAMSTSVFADENEVIALKEKVDILTKKLSAVEGKLAGVEGQVNNIAKPALAHTGHMPPLTHDGGMIKTAQDIEMGGHIDVQWNNNFRQPAGVTGTNTGRIFDRNDGSFSVNSTELWFENLPEEAGQTGFRVNLAFGDDTGVVAADGLTGDRVDLQEAYVQYIAPLSFFEGNSVLPDQVTLTAGRFVTLAGAEVIEGQDNWNISRSFMFGLAIPFTHTGVRSNFGLFNDYLDVYFGANNGWDLATDNNSFKTLEAGAGYDLTDSVSVFHAFYWGGEKADNPAGKRWLLTNVVTWDVTDKLSLMGEFDYGSERGIADTVPAFNTFDAAWWGLAGYARYQLTEKLAAAYRAEFFVDKDIFRGFGSDRNFGHTLTAEYALSDKVIARAEFRHDKSNDDNVFSNASHSSQSTIGAQLLYLI